MAPIVKISRALVNAGYLDEANVEAAQSILMAALQDEGAVAARQESLLDEGEQQNMVTRARHAAEGDVIAGDKKELRIDQSIIQDAIGKEQVDESTRLHAEKKIVAACNSAAKSLYHAGLIERTQVKGVTGLIQETWLGISN